MCFNYKGVVVHMFVRKCFFICSTPFLLNYEISHNIFSRDRVSVFYSAVCNLLFDAGGGGGRGLSFHFTKAYKGLYFPNLASFLVSVTSFDLGAIGQIF